ncbi:phage tail tube protein [Nocardia sp. NPDC051570]|uniref:phage tail tube protein n=1 Tax=Nocardia sp. NPDC051570 TaxID=3364324 RepID=UPI003790923C
MTTLQAPNSAGMATALARDYAVQVDINYGTAQSGTPEWVFVMGLNKVSPSNDITLQDDGDIHSNGRKSQIATAIGENLEIAGLRKGNLAAGFVADPGQEKLRSHGEDIGAANTAHVRYWRTDGIDEAKEGYFAASWVSAADDKEGLYGFTCTLTGKGQHKKIAKPTAPTAKTITLPSGSTGGTFTVTVDGQSTPGIAYNATAAAVKTALEALSTVGAGKAEVTGSAGGPYTVNLPGTVSTVTASGTSLTPSGIVTVA